MHIDYQKLLDESGLELVRKILLMVQNDGLHGNHHFYISFRTDYPDVILPSRVKPRYPKEITVVLQHQFDNLIIGLDAFSVQVSFDGINETIRIPFNSITAFVDPSANFTLTFEKTDEVQLENVTEQYENKVELEYAHNVVRLDQFRNKNKKS